MTRLVKVDPFYQKDLIRRQDIDASAVLPASRSMRIFPNFGILDNALKALP
jgi:hypothetical protein